MVDKLGGGGGGGGGGVTSCRCFFSEKSYLSFSFDHNKMGLSFGRKTSLGLGFMLFMYKCTL